MVRKIAVLAGLAAGVAVHAGIFDDDEAVAPQAPQVGAPQTADAAQATKLRLIPNGTKQMLIDRLQAAVATVQKAVDAAAVDGDTKTYDSLGGDLESLNTLLARAKTDPFLPGIYPLAIGKKGCLCAIREQPVKIGPAEAPVAITMPRISWFTVKVVEVLEDRAIRTEVYDTLGRTHLYSAILKGVDNPTLTAGKQAKLVNVAFECTGDEQGENGKIYYLKRIAAASLVGK